MLLKLRRRDFVLSSVLNTSIPTLGNMSILTLVLAMDQVDKFDMVYRVAGPQLIPLTTTLRWFDEQLSAAQDIDLDEYEK